MMGHSFGGATALLTLGCDCRLKQVALKYINTEIVILYFTYMEQHLMAFSTYMSFHILDLV
jgi:hypothetical protein